MHIADGHASLNKRLISFDDVEKRDSRMRAACVMQTFDWIEVSVCL